MESVNQLITWGDISMLNEVYKSAHNLDISMVIGACKSAYKMGNISMVNGVCKSAYNLG